MVRRAGLRYGLKGEARRLLTLKSLAYAFVPLQASALHSIKNDKTFCPTFCQSLQLGFYA